MGGRRVIGLQKSLERDAPVAFRRLLDVNRDIFVFQIPAFEMPGDGVEILLERRGVLIDGDLLRIAPGLHVDQRPLRVRVEPERVLHDQARVRLEHELRRRQVVLRRLRSEQRLHRLRNVLAPPARRLHRDLGLVRAEVPRVHADIASSFGYG
mgnify:CR=1 FL=1